MTPERKTILIKKNSFEYTAWQNQRLICGIDEVGRGCLSGPLVTAAVILPLKKISPLLKDSKVLSEKDRLKAYSWIIKHCWYGFGFTHNRVIDQVNIWQATLISMKKALLHACATCPEQPSAIVIDAMPLKIFDTGLKHIPVHFFPKGEQKSSSIAAASIIAKVKRDALMQKLNTLFPGYYMDEHKGYSTPKHCNAIKDQGYSIIHRMSFLSKIVPPDTFSGSRIGEKQASAQAYERQGALISNEHSEQQTLF